MDFLLGIFSLAALGGATAAWLSVWRPATRSEILPAGFIFLSSQIILLGYLLSQFNSLARAGGWMAGCCAWLFLALGTRRLAGARRNGASAAWRPLSPRALLAEITSWPRLDKILVLPPVFSAFLLAALGVVFITITVPHESDSLGYHLARVAYYYQHGDLRYFDADYWAIVAHPTNPAILMLYTFVASGKNESLLPLAQWIAYAISFAAVYGIARRLGCPLAWSMLAASLFALLPDALLESMAAENDLILTAYIACAVFFLAEFMRALRPRYLALAGACAALALGVKASALLCLPALGVVVIFALAEAARKSRPRVVPRLGAFTLGFCLATGAFVLPAGYWGNWRRLGNPLGPTAVVSSHSYVAANLRQTAQYGAMNLLRYAFDFLSLDGLEFHPAEDFQFRVRKPLVRACVKCRLYLDRPTGTRFAFTFYRKPVAHEDRSYWGILGFGLIWLSVPVAIFGKGRSSAAAWFATATLAFLFAQAFLGSYDIWRGRYFITCGIWACPMAACVLTKAGKKFRLYAAAVVLLGCLSAWSAFIIRNSFVLRSGGGFAHPDRLREMLADDPALIAPYEEFDRRVPAGAVVAVAEPPNRCEYALFGPKFQRRILPVNSFLRGMLPIPPEAQFFLYQGAAPQLPGTDIPLGPGWYLRKMP